MQSALRILSQKGITKQRTRGYDIPVFVFELPPHQKWCNEIRNGKSSCQKEDFTSDVLQTYVNEDSDGDNFWLTGVKRNGTCRMADIFVNDRTGLSSMIGNVRLISHNNWLLCISHRVPRSIWTSLRNQSEL